MTRTEIEALLHRHAAAFGRHDAEALAAEHEADGLFRSPAAGTVRGRAAVADVYRYWFAAFPDMQFTWDPPLIDGARAALFWTMTGTMSGPFFGVAAKGSHVEIIGAARYTFGDTGIAEASHTFDFSAVLMKIGVLKAKPA